MAQSKRFRVALSFPGEHRERVEKIAEALAARLGREKVLYDRWYAAEFNRPNLDIYLTALYHHESDIIAVFLCKEYNAKDWCGLEWRACRDRLKRKEDDALMFFRLDEADIAGLYSIDGYQDIRHMSDTDVAAAILSRIGEPAAPRGRRAFTAKLPIVNPTLIGREEQLAFLDRAWADLGTNFVQIIASGGTGKTALMDKWFRRHLGEADVFGWSFYSQGSSLDRQTSSDPFFAEIIAQLHLEIPLEASIYTKVTAVANRLREERLLLILDGVEPLQDSTGALRDLPLKALLQELDTANRGLVLCTTRLRLDIPDDPPRALSIELDNLTAEDGANYLRNLKAEGSDEELRKASREFGNHALALTLLGAHLADFYDRDISRRVEIRRLTGEEGTPYEHARRMIGAYEQMFAGKPELAILRALGYFDRPAEPEALKLVLPAMEDRKYRIAMQRLRDARLILTTDPAQSLDCHPLVREHFAADATNEGHSLLCEHYTKQAPHRPDTFEELTPLFYAVYHGCQAGRYQAALDNIYRSQILRGDGFYLTRKFGAFGTNLSLLANFFAKPWTQPVATLSAANRSWVMSQAGYTLTAVGRLADALNPLRASALASVESEDWINAAIRYRNFSELCLALGNVRGAITAAQQSVGFADRSLVGFQRIANRTTLADALHQSGDKSEAMRLCAEAERLQAEMQPQFPMLYSFRGYQYCDLLLSEGETADVLRRASQTLEWAKKYLGPNNIGLDYLSLGCAYTPGSSKADFHLGQAVDHLRCGGHLDMLPLALLARGTPHDLDEVFRIATRSGMRLHLANYHLASTRLALSSADRSKASDHFAKAETLIHETGYHRRDPELEELRAQLS